MRRPEPGTVLDRRTLNRTLLARQHLLARTATPVPVLVEHLVGMQAQVPRDPYIGLWSRVTDFEATELERLLLERRAVRMTLMRTTLHLVTSGDAPVLRAATQSVCERAFQGSPFRRRLDGIDVDDVVRAGVGIVEEAPRTVAELGRELRDRWPGEDPAALAYAVRYLVPLVQVTPRGLLRRSSAPRITTLRSWLGAAEPPARDMTLLETVVERYLRAFGPATTGDVRTWSWLPGIREIVARLRPRLRTYRDESGRELVDVEDGIFADPGEPAPVRFLGEYDNVFLAHDDRSRITGDGSWGADFVRQGTFFVDGFLAGAWRLRETNAGAAVELEDRRPLTSLERTSVEAEALALAAFLVPSAGRVEPRWTEA